MNAQRLILVIIDRPDPKTGQLPLIPEHFFLVTNWPAEKKSAVELLEHYRRRGTFEDRLGEFNAAIGLHLSSPKFHENEILLALNLFVNPPMNARPPRPARARLRMQPLAGRRLATSQTRPPRPYKRGGLRKKTRI